MARKDWTLDQNPLDEAAVLIAAEIWKLLDRLGFNGDMHGRIKDFEKLGDDERMGAVIMASNLVQWTLRRWPDEGNPLVLAFGRAIGGSAGTDA
jgi:hypothetical protein